MPLLCATCSNLVWVHLNNNKSFFYMQFTKMSHLMRKCCELHNTLCIVAVYLKVHSLHILIACNTCTKTHKYMLHCFTGTLWQPEGTLDTAGVQHLNNWQIYSKTYKNILQNTQNIFQNTQKYIPQHTDVYFLIKHS